MPPSEGLTPPPPASDEDAALEASIRHKFEMRLPLTARERAYFTRLPDRDVPPRKVQREALRGEDQR